MGQSEALRGPGCGGSPAQEGGAVVVAVLGARLGSGEAAVDAELGAGEVTEELGAGDEAIEAAEELGPGGGGEGGGEAATEAVATVATVADPALPPVFPMLQSPGGVAVCPHESEHASFRG